jgi:hypothetical protein
MRKKFTKPAEEFFEAAKDTRVPESIQAFAEDGLAKTRAAYDMATVAAMETGKSMQEVASIAQQGAKAIGEKVLENVAENTEAAFDIASRVMRAKSIPEAARLQAEFVQSQFVKAGEQTRELMELSANFAKSTFETMSTTAQRNFEQLKKAS